MKETELTGQQEYETLKEELGRKLDETSENFIVIGYILKQVRDKCLYLHENFKDINDFGLCIYGLSRATVSRFMNINTKFSIGGNSRDMKPEYRGYGRSKIQEMLNVDECDMELVTAETTVEQVKELKKMEKEQRQLEEKEREDSLPLMQLSAPKESGNKPLQESRDPFEALMEAFWKENMELYRSVAAGLASPEIIAEEISPAGSRTFRNGMNIMFFYEFDKGAKLRSYEKGQASITAYTYQEIMEKTQGIVLAEAVTALPIESEEQETAYELQTVKEEQKASNEPQTESEEQTSPYTPMPGQTTVEDLEDVMPEGTVEPAASPCTDTDAATTDENVVDAEYREVSIEPAAEETCIYTDIEIKNAMNYFDIEYLSRMGVQQDSIKRRNYKIALECICRCYPSIAEQADMGHV
ncbi:MAG: hypothetical protein OSJ73_20090 [Lachnospiraceae bacterium]|nr:hypothetical protein [Lachnospiraceae bacterium]